MDLEGDVSTTLSGVARLYADNLKEHGYDSKSVGWPDHASQQLRFVKLAEVIEQGVAQFTVNDFGCGYGAMFGFLDSAAGGRLTAYTGYDISREMIAAARTFVPDARARFVESNVLSDEADYTFASGTFNVRLEASDAVWTQYIQERLLEFARSSRRGFAFNVLSKYVDWRKDDLYYADPLHFFDFCKRNISRYVSLLHDYPLWEWTILVRQATD